ncbi:MAG: recombination mediator RecR [Nitrospirota bacterium]
MINNNKGIFARLIRELMRLPGIGNKTAQRLAFFILKMSEKNAKSIAQSIIDVKDKLLFCKSCNNISEKEICEICSAPDRDRKKILVVEEPSTLYIIEKTGEYKGLYYVLLGAISPLDGIGPSEIKGKELINRLRDSEIEEVIIATDPNIEGETTAIYLTDMIRPLGISVTRIAYGIPVGIDLEYADEVSLIKSIEGRRQM